MQTIQNKPSGLLGAPLPRGYDKPPRPTQSQPCPETFANMPRAWLSQLRIEAHASSDYARRQKAYERLIDAASLDGSD